MKYLSRLALPAALLLVAASQPFEQQLKEKDHKKLGDSIAAYYEAYSKKSEIAEAKADLFEVMEKLGESLSKKAKEDVQVLALPEDLAAAFAFSRQFPKRVTTGRTTEFEHDTFIEGVQARYSLRAPKGYKPGQGGMPLVVVIPSADQTPEQAIEEDWNHPDLSENCIVAAVVMPEDTSLWGKSGEGKLGGVEALMFALRFINQEYEIHPDRLYLAGRGEGVAAAGELASLFPYLYAGVIGRAGDLGDLSPTNFRNIPTYFSGTGAGVTTFEEASKAAGHDNVTIDPEGRIEDVWNWIQATTRDANPSVVSFSPELYMTSRAYWLLVDGFEPADDPQISAEIDREKNVIAITSRGISTVTLYFNDALVDLSRPVTVIANGVERTDTFQRNLSTALDEFYRTNDSARIYTAMRLYDLPAAKGE